MVSLKYKTLHYGVKIDFRIFRVNFNMFKFSPVNDSNLKLDTVLHVSNHNQ